MKKRLVSVLIKYAVLIFIGTAYLVWVLITDLKIPCPFYFITNLYCPGCGITRMLVSIAKLDFHSAFYYNPLLFVTLPFILTVLVVSEVNYVKMGERTIGILKYFIIVELILLIAFGIIRNLPFYC